MRILHVTECFGAGVGQAIRNAVTLLPEHDHHLLWSGEEEPEEELGLQSKTPLKSSLLMRGWQVRKLVREIRPDILHVHSSWAGVFCRVFPQVIPVVYQPHAFAFDDYSRPRFARFMFRLAESYFARHTDLIVTLSPAEECAANALSGETPVTRIPNATLLRPQKSANRQFPKLSDERTVVMVGRISQQKDPHFFSHVAQAVHISQPNIRFVWIGDGDRAMRQNLEAAGVHVTGWLQREELTTALETATLYFHSAAYEGFPLSVLEAAAFSLPIVVRRISTFEDIDVLSAHGEDECARLLLELFQNPEKWCSALNQAQLLDTLMHPKNHAMALNEVYESQLRGRD